MPHEVLLMLGHVAMSYTKAVMPAPLKASDPSGLPSPLTASLNDDEIRELLHFLWHQRCLSTNNSNAPTGGPTGKHGLIMFISISRNM